MKKIIYIVLICLLYSFSFSQETIELKNYTPIDWQKIKLQDKIEEKIESSLKPIIDPTEYSIEIQFDIDRKAIVEFTNKQRTKTNKANDFNFNNENQASSPEEFVVFSKLGLEAPIYKDVVETEDSDIALMEKSVVELADRFNIFKFLKSVYITLIFDEDLEQYKKDSIQKIVDNFSFNLDDIGVNIDLLYLKMKLSKNELEEIERLKEEERQKILEAKKLKEEKDRLANLIPKNAKERMLFFLEWVRKFSVMIGLVLSVLILGLIAFWVMRKLEKIMRESVGANSAGDSILKMEDDLDSSPDGAGGNELVSSESKLEELDGIERYLRFLENNKSDAMLLLKKWIKDDRQLPQDSLRLLVRSLSNDELLEIFSLLTEQERYEWKDVLEDDSIVDNQDEVKSFISEEIVNSLINPELVDDYELCDMLLSLSPDEGAKLCREKEQYGVLMLNILNPQFINSLFALLEKDEVNRLVQLSLEFDINSLSDEVSSLKDHLRGKSFFRRKSPFVSRISQLIPNTEEAYEDSLFTALYEAEGMKSVENLAWDYYPKSLVSELPKPIFLEIADTMDLVDQASLFYSNAGRFKFPVLDTYAEVGTKLRDILDLEIEKIDTSDHLKKQMLDDSEKIWDQFIKKSRNMIKEKVEYQQELRPILEEWLKASLVKNEISV